MPLRAPKVRTLPYAPGHDQLRPMPHQRIPAEYRHLEIRRGRVKLNMFDLIAGVKEPELGGLQPVESREVFVGQQKVNR